MEKKTNKAKLDIFIFLKISTLSLAFDNIGGNYALSENSIKKNMLIRVFLHAKFISAIKTVQIPTIFVKNAKE